MRATAKAVRRCSWLCVSLVATTIYVALRSVKTHSAAPSLPPSPTTSPTRSARSCSSRRPPSATPTSPGSRLSERGWLARQFIRGTPAASLVCQTMCLTRPLLARLAPRLANDVPDAVARDSVEHTWPAYRDALSSLLEDNPLPDSIDNPRRPTLIILGENDSQTPPEDVLAHPHEHIRVEAWPPDHLLPLRHADRPADLLHAELLSPSRSLPHDAPGGLNDVTNSRAL